jgi:HK97 gp10 family phage protein
VSNDVQIKGGRELLAALQSLPGKIERNIMRTALREGAKVLKAEAQTHVPVRHGDLRRSVRVKVRTKGSTIIASVTAGNEKAWYWRFVEYGTGPHWISVREGDRPWRNTRRGPKAFSIRTINRMAQRGSLKIGENFVGSSVAHPGAKATPFMRPALDTKARAAIAAAVATVKRRLTKEGINLPAGADDE